MLSRDRFPSSSYEPERQDAWSLNAHPRILIIIPAYNEAETLPALARELVSLYPSYDVVVIDDGSTDNTKEVMRKLGVPLVSLPYNIGSGGAVQTGLWIATREGYDIAVQMDGDGQHPASEVHKLLLALHQSDCDLVIGSRFKLSRGYQSTFLRRLGIRFFAWLLSFLCRTRITDPTSGLRAMNDSAIQLLAFEYAEDYPEVEAILTAHRAGLKITEVPVQMVERRAGHSTIGTFQAFSYMVKVPLAILMNLIRERSPKSQL